MAKEIGIVGEYELTSFPGSEGDICISHGALVYEKFQGKGIGQELHKERLQKIKDGGYTLGMCVVNAENAKQIHILVKNRWECIHTFISECSCHRLHIYVKNVWEA